MAKADVRVLHNNVHIIHFAFSILLFGFYSKAALSSPLASSINGITTPNAHVIYQNNAQVLRGMTPQNEEQYQEIKNFGVERFLIFKNETKNEVSAEITQLEELGVAKSDITTIPFPWKDIQDFQGACEMTIQALQAIRKNQNKWSEKFAKL